MNGYNATIFAYGQTSSGKTYTIEGASLDDEQLQGIIPRTATALFTQVLAADENIEFIVQVSYIEIYMEKIRDLLDPYRTKTNLQIREDAKRGIYIADVTEICVTSHQELLEVVKKGATNRAVAATGMNEGSSRSHSALTITMHQRNLETQSNKTGKLVVVDLAGSEMVGVLHSFVPVGRSPFDSTRSERLKLLVNNWKKLKRSTSPSQPWDK